MPLDSNLREALLAFAVAGFETRPLPSIDDWSALLAAAESYGLIPLADRLLRDGACPPEIKRALRLGAVARALRSAQLERELANVLRAMSTAQVPTIVMKGPAFARTIYPDPSLRPYLDFDILCHEEDWVAAHDVLLGLGFRALQPMSSPPPKVWPRKAYYHMQYYREEGGISVEIHYDPWWYGLRPRLGELFWQRAVPLQIAGVATRMLATEEQIIQSCLHLHHHGWVRLISFSDLALLVRRDDVDWDFVVATARTEGVDLVVYYGLHYLHCLLGVAAPGSVMAALRPGLPQRWVHHHFWPPTAILGLDVPDRVLFDFHEVPDAVELLLNLLLMGRRWEKMRYLGHLLTPSTDWLAYFYQTADPAVLRRRRLMHVPRLLLNAAGQLGHAALHGVARQAL